MKKKHILLTVLIGLLNILQSQTILNVGAGQTYFTIEDAYNAIPATITFSLVITSETFIAFSEPKTSVS